MSDNQDFEQLARLGDSQTTEVDENGLPTLRGLRGVVPVATKKPVEESWNLQPLALVPGRIKRFEYMQMGLDNETGSITHGSPATRARLHWEHYKSSVNDTLNLLGELGWEMCAAIPCANNFQRCTDYFFKREIKDL